jgi:hypothetical protein
MFAAKSTSLVPEVGRLGWYCCAFAAPANPRARRAAEPVVNSLRIEISFAKFGVGTGTGTDTNLAQAVGGSPLLFRRDWQIRQTPMVFLQHFGTVRSAGAAAGVNPASVPQI